MRVKGGRGWGGTERQAKIDIDIRIDMLRDTDRRERE